MTAPRPKSPYLLRARSLSASSVRVGLRSTPPKSPEALAAFEAEVAAAAADIRARRQAWEAGRGRVEVEPPVAGAIDVAAIKALLAESAKE